MDPFEVDDDNRPHLFKHMFDAAGQAIHIGLPDILDLYVWDAVRYYPADLSLGDAHWLMIGEVEGQIVTIPLAPPKSGDSRKCRPIGLYPAGQNERVQYFEDRR